VNDSEAKLRAQIAAHTSWANTEDKSRRTSPAREAMRQKFLDQAGGDQVKADHLWKAHFARLALKSAVSRRKSKEAREAAEQAERELAELDGDAQ
jgi:hypothetical protein